MKVNRYLLILLLIGSLLIMQGCAKDKEWSWDFTTQNINGVWELQTWNFEPHVATWDGNGLVLENMIAYAPVGFNGDFTATLTFSINADSVNQVALLDLFWADGNDAGAGIVSTIEFVARNIGGDFPTYEIYEFSPQHDLAEGTDLSSFNKDDINVMEFIKTGSNWTVKVNGDTLCNENLTNYAAPYYYPALNVTRNSLAEVVFKSIHVTYTGSMEDRP